MEMETDSLPITTMTTMNNEPIELNCLTSSLIELSNKIVEFKLQSHSNNKGKGKGKGNESTIPNYEPLTSLKDDEEEEDSNEEEEEDELIQNIIKNASPLFSNLNQLNRKNLNFIKNSKLNLFERKNELDNVYLKLQNLLFERNHLEREIKKCQEFESEYQTLSLLPLEEFLSLQSQSQSRSLSLPISSPPTPLPLPLLTNPLSSISNPTHPSTPSEEEQSEHNLTLSRLSFELEERKRLDEVKRLLGVRKRELGKGNDVMKVRLEELEEGVRGFVLNAKEIQAKMHSQP